MPPDSPFRGVAAAITQPASADDVVDQLSPIITGLTLYNIEGPRILYREPEGPRILCREPDNDQDIIEAVYRWDGRPPEEIFQTGFRPRPPNDPRDLTRYYNLECFVNSAGSPVDETPAETSVFVSTTRSTRWRPSVRASCILYRYEIFAPGGIDAVLTLRDRNHYPNQQEISFAGGIGPQYIRTAREYTVDVPPGSRYPGFGIADPNIYLNALFNPNPNRPTRRLRNPRCPAEGEVVIEYTARQKRSTEVISSVEDICKVGHYIECAFNFSDKQNAYLFIADRYLKIYYAPGTTDDKILGGPESIGNGFPYLKDTIFASGIDAAFTASTKNEAYIFRSNIYALINFDEGKIIQGPKLITDSFYSLKNTIFAKGIDAAFTSCKENEAYLFRGNQYALINFKPGTTDDYIIQGPKNITESFHSLKDTIFENGLDAAFSSSKPTEEETYALINEAYIFKGDTYALINFAPGTTDDYIIQGPKKITESFYSLKDILPMYSCSCD